MLGREAAKVRSKKDYQLLNYIEKKAKKKKIVFDRLTVEILDILLFFVRFFYHFTFTFNQVVKVFLNSFVFVPGLPGWTRTYMMYTDVGVFDPQKDT